MNAVAKFLSPIATAGIRSYRRYISPHKGFACAYRLNCGGASCSNFAETAIRRHGIWQGFRLLRRRLRLCTQAHGMVRPRRLQRSHGHQAGFCDDAVGCAWIFSEIMFNGYLFTKKDERNQGDEANNSDSGQDGQAPEDKKSD